MALIQTTSNSNAIHIYIFIIHCHRISSLIWRALGYRFLLFISMIHLYE